MQEEEEEEEDITSHDMKIFKTRKAWKRCLLSRLLPGDVVVWDGQGMTFINRLLDENGIWDGESVEWTLGYSPRNPEFALFDSCDDTIDFARLTPDMDMCCDYVHLIAILSRKKTTRLKALRVKGDTRKRKDREEEDDIS